VKVLNCAATKRRLQEFHDEELPVAEQISVGAHLEWCTDCAAAFAELRIVRTALRKAAGHATLSEDEQGTLSAAVISRVRAERTASFFVRVRAMFDDMHLVYAGAGAAAAALFCVLSVSTMLSFAQPGSNRNPVSLSGHVLAPVALNGGFATLIDPADASDSVFMIRAVITREGTVENPELVRATSGLLPIAPGTQGAKTAETLMGAVSRARFEPARVDGLPVAVNMVWMVANTTVRADKPLARRPSGSRKPVAWHTGFGAPATTL
jgi:anti-sigma factor RsiW